MKKLICNIHQHLKNGNSLILASIVKSSGSTPRSSGSKMAVYHDGSIDGTIGGGLVEALIQRAAAEIFETSPGSVSFKDFDMSNSLAANADMICGGHVSVMMEHLPADKKTIHAYSALEEFLRKGQKAVMFICMDNSDLSSVSSRFVLRADTAELPEIKSMTAHELSIMKTSSFSSGVPVINEVGSERIIAESYHPQEDLFIFGAGHVSRPTAELASSVNFRTTVIDDRSDFANAERFPKVDQLIVIPDFKDSFTDIEVTENSYIIIVTRGHLHDKTVLEQALRTSARYIGMIGSSSKRNAIYDALRKEGVSQVDIDRCHCPIGLEIGAQTPEEISVSILAELIQIRSEG